jgi:hypothetical protein
VSDSAYRGIALDLWARWNQDVASATLLARRDYPAVERLVPYAEAIVTDAEQAVPSGGSRGAAPLAPQGFQQRFASYNARAFLAMLRVVSANRGDPPAPARWREQASEILEGKAAPEDAIRDSRDRVELLPGELDEMIKLAQACQLDPRPLLWSAGRLAAALSLPRDALVRLLGGPGARQATEAQAAAVLDPRSALDRAASTPTPDDDVAALQAILLASPPAEPALIRRAAEQAIALVDAGHVSDELAQIVAFLELRTPAARLAGELDADLSDAALRILGAPLSRLMHVTLSIHTTRALVRRGRPDLAEAVLARLPADLSTDERLQAACLDAEIRAANSDDEGAMAALLDALAEAHGAEFETRWQALSQLIAVWPTGRTGLDPWIAEFESLLPAADKELAPLGRRQIKLARQKAAVAGRTDV